MGIPCGCVFVLLAGSLVAAAVLERFSPERNVTCSKGLLECTVQPEENFSKPPDFGPVEVSELEVTQKLCCDGVRKCRICLLIKIMLSILPEGENSDGTSGDHEDEDRAGVTVSIHSPPNNIFYRRILFTLTPAARKNQNAQLTLMQYEGVHPTSSVNIMVSPWHQVAEIPPLNTLCRTADLEECTTPTVFPEIDRKEGVVRLKEANENSSHPRPLQMCVKRGKGPKGKCWPLSPSSNRTVPLHSVTPCLCFQVWVEGSDSRLEFCPFTNNREFRENVMRNVSLSVRHGPTNEGHPMLSWNLSAPCRLEAELWPCRLEAASRCREMKSFRAHINTNSGWVDNKASLFIKGAFVNVSHTDHLLHCVMLKVDKKSTGPWCQNDTRRVRWSTPVIVTLLVLCLATLGVCALRKKLKEWLSKFDKRYIDQGGRGEVLLLHSCSSEDGQITLVCRLAHELSKRGFRVSLDLWSQEEVCAVGPGPWLHSRLGQVQKHGGKAMLVLSDSALERAWFFWNSWNEEEKKDGLQALMEGRKKVDEPLPSFSDVFGFALNCVFSDYLKGGTVERFSLVQFDTQEPVNSDRVWPELFRGLQLYRLPRDARRLLAELSGERPQSGSGKLKRLLWLRNASRKLAKGTNTSESSQRSRTESTLTQMDTLSVERVEEEEKVPLQI